MAVLELEVGCPLESKCQMFQKYKEIACKTCVPKPRSLHEK